MTAVKIATISSALHQMQTDQADAAVQLALNATLAEKELLT